MASQYFAYYNLLLARPWRIRRRKKHQAWRRLRSAHFGHREKCNKNENVARGLAEESKRLRGEIAIICAWRNMRQEVSDGMRWRGERAC